MNLLFFKLALRNILRNKFHSLINIVGFSIGIATVLFIFLFVKFETGFDNFHAEGKQLYRVTETWDMKGSHSVSGFSCYPDAPEIAATIPGIRGFCRISDGMKIKLFKGDQFYKVEKLRFADDGFFTFFGFRLYAGDPATVLNSADKIVLSRRMAVQLFGKKDPLGQTLIYNQKPFTVSGISEDMPANTHLKYDALISIKYIEIDKEDFSIGWAGGMQFLSYLKLEPHATPEKVEASMPDLFYQKVNKKNEGSGFKLIANLQNIKEVHLSTGENRYDCPDNRSRSSIMIVAGIGLLILLLAVVNYISLYVVQKNEKIRVVSLLSVHGASRRQLNIQAYIEVLIVSVVSSVSGLYLFSILSPFLNDYLKTSVSLYSNLLPALFFIVCLNFFLSIIITLLSTHSLFKFRITDTLKANILTRRSNNFTGIILVTFQFTIVVFLVVSVLVINRQNKYVTNKDYGFTKANILSLFPDKEFKHNELAGFKQELAKMAEINKVSLSSQGVGTGLTMNGYRITGETENRMLNVIYTDAGFLDCFGIGLVSGRNFKEGTTQDNFSILINQKLAQVTGWKDPINQTIDRNGRMKIIGVVQDFNFESLYSEIKPLIIMCNPGYDGWGYNCVNIRYQTNDIQTLIRKIRKLWETEYPGIPYEISFLEDQLNSNYESIVAQQKIVTFFSILSIIIACMGLLGLTSFLAIRRTKEIGIRRINGAKITEVIFMLNKDFLKWVILSILIATPLSFYIMKVWLHNFAYKTELSWWIFILAGLIVFGIALFTVSWQSWRAATRNPVEALRYE
jgi:putative ABC transport system permease protein